MKTILGLGLLAAAGLGYAGYRFAKDLDDWWRAEVNKLATDERPTNNV